MVESVTMSLALGIIRRHRVMAIAERLAKATKGVREVKNDLTVTAGAASPRTR